MVFLAWNKSLTMVCMLLVHKLDGHKGRLCMVCMECMGVLGHMAIGIQSKGKRACMVCMNEASKQGQGHEPCE